MGTGDDQSQMVVQDSRNYLWGLGLEGLLTPVQ
jgi:hypothetical protein